MAFATERYDETSIAVTDGGDVRPLADFTDADGNPIEVADYQIPLPAQAESAQSAKQGDTLRTGPLETKVDDWMELHKLHRPVTAAEACTALGIPYEDYSAEVDANVSDVDPVENKLSPARRIILARRAERLAACTDETERSRLKAQFAAQDRKRELGPMA